METLSSTEPHYIRCVKPNNLLKPAIFENTNVIQQLRCGVRFLNSVSIIVARSVELIKTYRRVFLKLSGSAVLDTPQEKHFTNLSIVLVSLLLKF